jgi:glutathione peroxidase
MVRTAAALLSSFVLPLALAQPQTPPAAPKPAEVKPAEVKPVEVKPVEVKPAEVKPAEPAKEPVKPADPYVLGYAMKDIDGKEQKLDQYKGKVVLIVNVASECGLTPQYKSLQKLFTEKKDKGLVILGFPANDFAGQEPGKDADIKSFCEKNYGVTFPIFSKISVKGEGQHALFKQLAGQAKPLGGDPSWNFTKFLVNKEGKVVARFEPRIDPLDATLGKKIDELLGEGGAAPAPAKKDDQKEEKKPDAPAKAK